jgi:hypothetical protein
MMAEGHGKRRWWPFAALGVVLLLGAVALPTRHAKVPFGGDTLVVPLSIWSVRTGASSGAATYIGLGDPELARTGEGWVHEEQLGAAHTLRGHGVRLIIVTQKKTRLFTQMRFRVR